MNQRSEILNLVKSSKKPCTIKLIEDVFDERVKFCLNLGDNAKRTIKILGAISRKLIILNQHSIKWLKTCLKSQTLENYDDYLEGSS